MKEDRIRLPEVAALELTYRCSHRCLFCSCPWEADPGYRREELSTDEWKEAVGILADNGVRAITLTGGEPLMRPDIRELIGYVSDLGLQLTLIPNGRDMDGAFLRLLAGRGAGLCISVPGISTFEAHTGVDNVDHVLGLFRQARDLGMRVTANVTVTKLNLPELYENLALPLIHGAEYILLNRFLPGGRGLQHRELMLNAREVNEMLDTAETVLAKAGRYGHVGTELPLCAVRDPGRYRHLQVSSRCAAAKGFFVVDPSGYVKVCNHSPVRVCRYPEIGTLEENGYWRAYTRRDYIPAMCAGCEKGGACDGGCREAAHVFRGSIHGADPLFPEDREKP